MTTAYKTIRRARDLAQEIAQNPNGRHVAAEEGNLLSVAMMNQAEEIMRLRDVVARGITDTRVAAEMARMAAELRGCREAGNG